MFYEIGSKYKTNGKTASTKANFFSGAPFLLKKRSSRYRIAEKNNHNGTFTANNDPTAGQSFSLL